ncbi:hypothetical protein [Variovorax saccharolyticus]|uniref:hypothetical protein n=1 Tax=Variovorax saccharolyticus TaxID=3053516 RepID=UPI0025782CC3|nr:hypothetical protein [Variovorax sp. J31P216]MDM0028391.1 hypothetical protein [Variovorax sp. J31P216]
MIARLLALSLSFSIFSTNARSALEDLEGMASADQDRKIIELPVIVATPRAVFMQIERAVTGESTTTNRTQTTVTTTRTNEENVQDESSWEQTIKRDASARISAGGSTTGGSGFSATGTAGYEEASKATRRHSSVRNEVSKDKFELDQLRDEITKTQASFAADSGRFNSSVILRNSSPVAGYVSNMRVVLKTQAPGSSNEQILDAFYVCSLNGEAKEYGEPSVEPAAGTCNIPVPAYDPTKPTIEALVTFTKFNTGRILQLLGQDVWLDVDPLHIVIPTSKSVQTRQAADVLRNLNTYAIRFTVLRPNNSSIDYYYLTKTPVSPADALNSIFKKRLKISADGTRILELEKWRSQVNTWGDPANYKAAELDEGAWVWVSDGFNGKLTDTALPGEAFQIFFMRKRDRLLEEPSYVFKTYTATPDVQWPQAAPRLSEATCGTDTQGTRRVLIGDKVRISFAVQQKLLSAEGKDLEKGPNDAYKPYFKPYKAVEFVPVPSGLITPLLDVDLSKYGIGLRPSVRSTAKNISEWAKLDSASVRRTDDGYVIVEFTITKDMLLEGRGEMCTTFEPQKQQLTIGRDFTPLPTQGGTIATVPGAPMGPTIYDWKNENPLGPVSLPIPSLADIVLTIQRKARASDDVDLSKRDHDLDWYLSPTCRLEISKYRGVKPNFEALEACPLDAKLSECLARALPPPEIAFGSVPRMAPIPADGSSAATPPAEFLIALKKQTIAQACQNRRVRAQFIAGCSGKELQVRDRYCETRFPVR